MNKRTLYKVTIVTLSFNYTYLRNSPKLEYLDILTSLNKSIQENPLFHPSKQVTLAYSPIQDQSTGVVLLHPMKMQY